MDLSDVLFEVFDRGPSHAATVRATHKPTGLVAEATRFSRSVARAEALADLRRKVAAQHPLEAESARDRVAAYLRRMAPTQSHEMRRAFIAAAEEIEHPVWASLPGDPPLSESEARRLAGLPKRSPGGIAGGVLDGTYDTPFG